MEDTFGAMTKLWEQLQQVWQHYVDEANRRKLTPQSSSFISTIAFRTADGTAYRNPAALRLPRDEVKDILSKDSDWIFLMDEEHTQVAFPPEIVETAKRPDITIYSAVT